MTDPYIVLGWYGIVLSSPSTAKPRMMSSPVIAWMREVTDNPAIDYEQIVIFGIWLRLVLEVWV